MDCGSFKIYVKNGTRSITVNGGSWKDSNFSGRPTNLDPSHYFGGSINCKADDNAITLNGWVNENGECIVTQVNHYSGSITTTARYRVLIIEFL